MTPEQQRIAIAEFCGWVWYRIPNPGGNDREHRMLAHPAIHEYGEQSPEWLVRADGSERQCNWEYMEREGHVPDYLKDLNAMHDAEMAFKTAAERAQYYRDLAWVVSQDHTCNINATAIIFATAPQRAEALLRAIGKWVGGEI